MIRDRFAMHWRCATVAVFAYGTASTCDAAPPVRALSEAPNDGPIRYTVVMKSKSFGNEQQTRTLRSGQSDDFTWQGAARQGARAMPQGCPQASLVALDANGIPVTQVQLRLAVIVGDDRRANVQLHFRGFVPDGTKTVNVEGKNVDCPVGKRVSQVVRFSMPTATGSRQSIVLGDGTLLMIEVSRK